MCIVVYSGVKVLYKSYLPPLLPNLGYVCVSFLFLYLFCALNLNFVFIFTVHFIRLSASHYRGDGSFGDLLSLPAISSCTIPKDITGSQQITKSWSPRTLSAKASACKRGVDACQFSQVKYFENISLLEQVVNLVIPPLELGLILTQFL